MPLLSGVSMLLFFGFIVFAFLTKEEKVESGPEIGRASCRERV